MARDAIKLALPGFRHSVEWWVPAHPPGMGPGSRSGCSGYQTGSLAARVASGRLRGPWVQELKSFPSVLRCGR